MSTLIGAETSFALQHEMLTNVRFGSKADIDRSLGMSALPPKADMRADMVHVRFVPIANIDRALVRFGHGVGDVIT
jgi:hypothetical protein